MGYANPSVGLRPAAVVKIPPCLHAVFRFHGRNLAKSANLSDFGFGFWAFGTDQAVRSWPVSYGPDKAKAVSATSGCVYWPFRVFRYGSRATTA